MCTYIDIICRSRHHVGDRTVSSRRVKNCGHKKEAAISSSKKFIAKKIWYCEDSQHIQPRQVLELIKPCRRCTHATHGRSERPEKGKKRKAGSKKGQTDSECHKLLVNFLLGGGSRRIHGKSTTRGVGGRAKDTGTEQVSGGEDQREQTPEEGEQNSGKQNPKEAPLRESERNSAEETQADEPLDNDGEAPAVDGDGPSAMAGNQRGEDAPNDETEGAVVDGDISSPLEAEEQGEYPSENENESPVSGVDETSVTEEDQGGGWG